MTTEHTGEADLRACRPARSKLFTCSARFHFATVICSKGGLLQDAEDKPTGAHPRAGQSAAHKQQDGVEDPAASPSLDLDQSASDSDQAASESDQSTSDSAQSASDRDQAAADEDQAASDQESAAGSDQQARDAASVRRQHATQL